MFSSLVQHLRFQVSAMYKAISVVLINSLALPSVQVPVVKLRSYYTAYAAGYLLSTLMSSKLMLPLLVTAGFVYIFLSETLSLLNLLIGLAVVAVALAIIFNQSKPKSKE